MAKTTNSTATTPTEKTAATATTPAEETAATTSAEATAEIAKTPVEKAAPIATAKTRWIRLANPGTSFIDPDTEFRLVADEVKELGKDAGKLTLTWLRNGGLVEADAPLDAGQTSKKSGKK